jgi:hypothetical protein
VGLLFFTLREMLWFDLVLSFIKRLGPLGVLFDIARGGSMRNKENNDNCFFLSTNCHLVYLCPLIISSRLFT